SRSRPWPPPPRACRWPPQSRSHDAGPGPPPVLVIDRHDPAPNDIRSRRSGLRHIPPLLTLGGTRPNVLRIGQATTYRAIRLLASAAAAHASRAATSRLNQQFL